MFGKPIHLFRLFGFPIRLDPSWFIVAVLITWTLASALFPTMYGGLGLVTYIGMGIAGALGLFASVILHEMGHSLVARHYGLPIKGITLFIFGGVAELEDEPRTARDEFLVAVAGPIVSLFIAMGTLALATLGVGTGWPVAVVGVLSYLASVNLLVVLFNMVPAFPLDGGRVLRSALWKWRGNLQYATRITANIGSGFGFVLIALGVVNILLGSFIGGLWWLLIGLFLRSASSSSYRHVLVRQVLEGEPVRRLMASEPVTVASDISVQELVDQYVYGHYYKLFPVVDGERVSGCVHVRDIKQVPQEQWPQHTVLDVMTPCSPENTISPDTDAMEALSRLQRSGRSRLMVVEGDQLRGVLTIKDLMHFFSLKMELEGESAEQSEASSDRAQRQQPSEQAKRPVSGSGRLGYDGREG